MADNAGNRCYAPRGVGEIVQLELADPAVGVSFSYLLPGLSSAPKYIARLLGVRCQLDTDANAADRAVLLYTRHPDSSDEINLIPPQTTDVQAASLIRQWIFQPGLPYHSYYYPSNIFVCMPADVWLLPGGSLVASLVNVQVGDQFTKIKILLQRWQVE